MKRRRGGADVNYTYRDDGNSPREKVQEGLLSSQSPSSFAHDVSRIPLESLNRESATPAATDPRDQNFNLSLCIAVTRARRQETIRLLAFAATY